MKNKQMTVVILGCTEKFHSASHEASSPRCFRKQRNCRSLGRPKSPYLRKRRNRRSLVYLEIASCASKGVVPSAECATGAAGRQRKTSKLQNCLMTGYPGYRSGEVITRLRGANKTRAASLITTSSFSNAFLAGASSGALRRSLEN